MFFFSRTVLCMIPYVSVTLLEVIGRQGYNYPLLYRAMLKQHDNRSYYNP